MSSQADLSSNTGSDGRVVEPTLTLAFFSELPFQYTTIAKSTPDDDAQTAESIAARGAGAVMSDPSDDDQDPPSEEDQVQPNDGQAQVKGERPTDDPIENETPLKPEELQNSVFYEWIPENVSYDIDAPDHQRLDLGNADLNSVLERDLNLSMASRCATMLGAFRMYGTKYTVIDGKLYALLDGPEDQWLEVLVTIVQAHTGLQRKELFERASQLGMGIDEDPYQVVKPLEDLYPSGQRGYSRQHVRCMVRNHLIARRGRLCLMVRKASYASVSLEGDNVRIVGLIRHDVDYAIDILKRLFNTIPRARRRRYFDEIKQRAIKACASRRETYIADELEKLRFKS